MSIGISGRQLFVIKFAFLFSEPIFAVRFLKVKQLKVYTILSILLLHSVE